MTQVLVVGAGLAGLCAATQLQIRGIEVVVVDKGRGPGGRMATRRLDQAGDALADHGAQFFTVRSPEFADLISDWPIEVWHHGPATAGSISDPPSSVEPAGDGHPRHRGRGGMNAIAKHLAVGLDVRSGVRVTEVAPEDGRMAVRCANGTTFHVDHVLLTCPVPQAAALLAQPLPADLTALRYEPCIALLAVLDGPSGLPAPGALQLRSGPVRFVADNQQKGISAVPTITVHATGDWSAQAAAQDDDTIVAQLAALVQPWLSSAIQDGQVKRWRYATPLNPHAQRAVQLGEHIILSGDAFGGPKVEGACLSGLAAAALVPG